MPTDENSARDWWEGKTDPTKLTTDALRREIAATKDLIQAEMDVIRQRLADMDTATSLRAVSVERRILDRDASVVIAFTAAKEQATERQTSINKSIDQMSKIMEATTGKVDGKVDDLRERMTAMESWSKGVAEQKKNTGDNWGLIFGVVGMIWALVATIAAVFQFAHKGL